jgi:hypothetical protein
MNPALKSFLNELKRAPKCKQVYFCLLCTERLHLCVWTYSRINRSIDTSDFWDGLEFIDKIFKTGEQIPQPIIQSTIRDLDKLAHRTEGPDGRDFLESQVLSAIICQIMAYELLDDLEESENNVITASQEVVNAVTNFYASVMNRVCGGYDHPTQCAGIQAEETTQIKLISAILGANVDDPVAAMDIRVDWLVHLIHPALLLVT